MNARDEDNLALLTIETLLTTRPEAANVFLRRRMACIGCPMARFETLAEAAREYRLDLPKLIAEVQSALAHRPWSRRIGGRSRPPNRGVNGSAS